ncbi:MAG: arylsulfotransferase family protein [Candidatus Moraniibacteriota bacterium]
MILAIILIIFIIFYVAALLRYKKACPAKSSSGDSVLLNEKKVDRSFVLLSPYIASDQFDKRGVVYLLDLFGKIVHKWETDHQIFSAFLKKNGNILVSNVIANNLDNYPGGGKSGCISELDWDGNVIWEYYNELIHHDFEIMSNGNIATLMYERTPRDFAKKVKGGIPDSECDGSMWSDSIIEIDQSREIVWKWCGHEHLNAEECELNELTPRSELMHSNSIRYLEKDPIDGEQAFLISMRHLNTVAIVKKRNGKIIWNSPKGMFSYQHDATLLPNGNILVFDNGLFRPQKRPFLYSRILEVNPIDNKIVWWFSGGKTGSEKSKFASSILGSTQRLENGNTLIVDGLRGYLFEVTPEKEIIWDFINPCNTYSTGAWPNNIIFRARRYRKEKIAWPKRLPDPLPRSSLILNKSLSQWI